MVYLPASGVLFTGDVMMPYLGAPFFAEGSPEGLLATLRFIAGLGPRCGPRSYGADRDLHRRGRCRLLPALTDLREQAVTRIDRGMTLTALLDANYLPDVLRGHPAAVAPYLVIRDHFLQRLYHQRTGYWQADGQGLEPVGPAERADALDLLAEGRPERFAEAVRTLLARHDHALALEVVTAGLARHPDARELTGLRQQALYRLMERHQVQDPFRFLVYAELAGTELGPAR